MDNLLLPRSWSFLASHVGSLVSVVAHFSPLKARNGEVSTDLQDSDPNHFIVYFSSLSNIEKFL